MKFNELGLIAPILKALDRGRLKGLAKRTAAQDRAFSKALMELVQRGQHQG